MRLIDADALKELYEMGDELKNYEKVLSVPLPVIQQNIKDMPTIDVVPVKHGRWIPLEYDGYADGFPVWDLWECSKCQEEHSGDEDTLTPYCPNCGAKMDLEG